MVVQGIPVRKKDRIIAPDHSLFSDPVRQLPECRNEHFLLIRQSRLDLPPISGQGKLKIIHITAEFIQIREHGHRVLRPEHNTVDHFRGKIYPAHLMMIHGIPHTEKACPETPDKPFAVIIRYIRTSAHTQYHKDHSNPFHTCSSVFRITSVNSFISLSINTGLPSFLRKQCVVVPQALSTPPSDRL